MLKVEVGFSGVQELASRCRVEFLITPFAARFTRGQAEAVRAAAERLAPKKSGYLAAHHDIRMLSPYSAEVYNSTPYAPFVHEGTRPHFPPASSGLPYPVRRAISLHGTKAHPWFPQAVEQASQTVSGRIETLAEGIAGAWKGQ